MSLNLAEIKESWQRKTLPARFLLSRFSLPDLRYRHSDEYTDPDFYPFYFHLGLFYKAKTILDIGVGLGLRSGCYLQSCQEANFVQGLQVYDDEFVRKYTWRNLRSVYKGKLEIYGSKMALSLLEKINVSTWDLVFFSHVLDYNETILWLQTIWDKLTGIVVLDHLQDRFVGKAYVDFCKFKELPEIILPTRHQSGILEKKNGI